MSLYSVLGIIMLAIGLIVILVIVTQLYKALPSVIRGTIIKIKQMFCCNIVGCTGGIDLSKLNPLCYMLCGNCNCAYCE